MAVFHVSHYALCVEQFRDTWWASPEDNETLLAVVDDDTINEMFTSRYTCARAHTHTHAVINSLIALQFQRLFNFPQTANRGNIHVHSNLLFSSKFLLLHPTYVVTCEREWQNISDNKKPKDAILWFSLINSCENPIHNDDVIYDHVTYRTTNVMEKKTNVNSFFAVHKILAD